MEDFDLTRRDIINIQEIFDELYAQKVDKIEKELSKHEEAAEGTHEATGEEGTPKEGDGMDGAEAEENLSTPKPEVKEG